MAANAELANHVINDTNITIYNILRKALGNNVKIVFGSPADDGFIGDITLGALYVFLYNIMENPFAKNGPFEYRGGDPLTAAVRPPLALNLYYMFTPVSPVPSPATTGIGLGPPDRLPAHLILAQTMRALYDNAVLDPQDPDPGRNPTFNFFPPNTTLNSSDKIRICLNPSNLEELTKVWTALTKPYRLSVCYEVSVIRMESQITKSTFVVKEPRLDQVDIYHNVAKVDNIILDVPFTKREISSFVPSRVQPGMSLSISCKNIQGKNVKIKFDNNPLSEDKDFVKVNENLIKVRVPPNTTAGIKNLAINIDGVDQLFFIGGKDNPFYPIEVLAVTPHAIQITEIRPQRGKPGDIISIYGINLKKGSEISVDGQRVSDINITFVDSNQINIMIPQGVQSGKRNITLKSDDITASREFEII